jgi:hypothetical protein
VVTPAPPIVAAPVAGAATAPGSVSWVRTTGAARDVGVGANGAVWVIGRNAVPGGYDIYRRDGEAWTRVPGGAVRIAVDAQGNAWVVNDTQNVFRHDGSKWVMMNRAARDVGVGANGTVWVIGNDPEAGGYGIHRSTDQGASWTKVPGSALRVSVDPAGNAWVVNNTGGVFRHDGSQWVPQPGTAQDIGVGADGAVWTIGPNGGIYRFEGSSWVQKPGGASDIAAGPNGIVWVVNAGGEIYQAQAAPAPAAAPVASLPAAPIVLQGASVSMPVTGPVVTSGSPGVAVPGASAGSGTLTTGGSPIILNQGVPVTGQAAGGLIVGGAATAAAAAHAIGPVGTSTATCGAQGKGLCSPVAASFVRNATIQCPSGSFADLGLSSCWSCPSGYSRSLAAVDTAKACQKPDASVQGGYLAASYKGPLCPEGTFHDPIRGGECYSCPGGYSRSAAHIDAPNACYIPMSENLSRASRHNNTIWPHECAAGTFHDVYDGGACWSCPNGYRRTANHIANSDACAQTVGEQWSRATLVKKAQCGPGEFYDMKIEGAQNFARGGGCWTCPVATDRTIHAVDTAQACERAPGLAFSVATRVQAMTCEPHEIFDPINSDNGNVSAALAARNARNPGSPVSAASSGGTCWTCPAGSKRTVSPVYGGSACQPSDIVWKSAAYNQPGLFGLAGAEAVALKLVSERTLINRIIQDLQTNAAADGLPANFAQVAWEEIGRRPQDSFVLKMAVFSRVVAAANTPASATPEEMALLNDVIEQIRRFRVFMAQDALDAYRAWKGGSEYRKSMYLRSQLQVIGDVGEVPPDFEEITAATILGGLAAGGASATAIGLTISSPAVFKSMFPYAARTVHQFAAGSRFAGTAVGLSSSIASIGPQIIVAIGAEILAVAIEQQIDIANAEPKLLASLATAQNYRADFARLMSTPAGTAQAQGYWSNLMAGPARLPDGSQPPAIAPRNLQAFAQHAAAARTAASAPVQSPAPTAENPLRRP